MLLLQKACRRPQTVIATANGYLRGRTTATSWQHEYRPSSTDATVVIAAAGDHLARASGLVGIWQTLSNSTPVAVVQDALVMIHDKTGLPWWASIALSTVLLRSAVTLPLTVYQHKITARIEKCALEMPGIVEELKREAAMAKQKYKLTDQQIQVVYRRSVCPSTNILKSNP